jgi:hypothetical protein
MREHGDGLKILNLKERYLLCHVKPCEIFEMIEQGIIPDGIRKDIEKQSNGSSPI